MTLRAASEVVHVSSSLAGIVPPSPSVTWARCSQTAGAPSGTRGSMHAALDQASVRVWGKKKRGKDNDENGELSTAESRVAHTCGIALSLRRQRTTIVSQRCKRTVEYSPNCHENKRM